jgi:hypothetical protein
VSSIEGIVANGVNNPAQMLLIPKNMRGYESLNGQEVVAVKELLLNPE